MLQMPSHQYKMLPYKRRHPIYQSWKPVLWGRIWTIGLLQQADAVPCISLLIITFKNSGPRQKFSWKTKYSRNMWLILRQGSRSNRSYRWSQLTVLRMLHLGLDHFPIQCWYSLRRLMGEGFGMVTCGYHTHRTAATVRTAGRLEANTNTKAEIRSDDRVQITANNEKTDYTT